MSSETMISVRGLCKAYTIGHSSHRATTLAEAIAQRVRHPLQRASRETFWAVSDVSFDVKRGDVVGIIGRNGAGKSTLFKLLSRITPPTTGVIDLFGRVGSLLEVGTGFSAELTGRENIYLNGTILGMKRREISARFDEIVEFSGVSAFLDTPVKRYSSGMYVRLAFAVAAHLDPEILIVDEVLSVGDAEFQEKCLGRIRQVARDGRTVLFVSHNMSSVTQLCNRVMVMNRGQLQFDGDVAAGTAAYMEALQSSARQNSADSARSAPPSGSSTPRRPRKSPSRFIASGRPSDGCSSRPTSSTRWEISFASVIRVSSASGSRMSRRFPDR
jgi:lipopolysaccharide transport system ATP-binding protein